MNISRSPRVAAFALTGALTLGSMIVGGTASPAAAVLPRICTTGSTGPCDDVTGIAVCEDEPCVEIQRLFFSNAGRINVVWSGSADTFHIRWSRRDGYRKVELAQRSVGSRERVAKLAVGPAARADVYSVSIQGCNKHFLQRSTCGDWSAGWIIPAVGEGHS